MELRIRKQGAILAPQIIESKHSTTCTDSTSWYFSGGYSSIPNGTKETMSDYVVPDFKKRKAKGEVFFNGMQREEVTVSTVGSGYEVYGIGTNKSCTVVGNNRYAHFKTSDPVVIPLISTPGVAWGMVDGVSLPPEFTALSALDVSRAQELSSTEVLARRGLSDSDLWESLAEYRQTIEMINLKLSTLTDLVKRLFTALSQGTASRQILREVSGAYLLYRYGVLPLMRDIESLVRSLSKASGVQRKTTRDRQQLHAVASRVGTGTIGSISANWSCETIETVTIRCMSLEEVEMSLLANLGLSFKGLLGLPWQLLSYSFVIDWLVNMGSYIQSTIPAPGYKNLGSCMVTHRVLVNTYRVSGAFCNQPTILALSGDPGGTCSIVRQTTVRSPLRAPAVNVKLDFKIGDFTRVADAFSLLAQRFTKVSNLIGPQPNLSAFRDKKAYQNWRSAVNREIKGS